MHHLPPARHAVLLLAGALLLALIVGAVALWQGGALPVLAAGTTPTPCLVDRDVPYYGGAAPMIARPPSAPISPAPPPPPNSGGPTLPGDRHIPPRPPLQNPCQLQLLDGHITP